MQGVRGSSPRSSTNRDETPKPHPSPARRGVIRLRGPDVTETTETSDPTEARTRIERYDPTAIEPRWQARWAELGLYETDLLRRVAAQVLPADDVPVPVGRPAHRPLVHRHARPTRSPASAGCTATTSSSRSASMRSGCRPRTRRSRTASTRATGRCRTSSNMRRQFRTMGATFDWDARGRHRRSRPTTAGTSGCSCASWRPGLAYRAMSPVDWCPNDGTLAREQVEGPTATAGAAARRSRSATWSSGSCARPRTPTSCSTSRGIDWPEPIRIQQTNWIGRSEGAEIDFEVAPDDHQPGGDRLRVFTTRPDTLFGATFMVLAPEHPLVAPLTAPGSAGRGRGVRRAGPPADRDRSAVDRSREDRRRTRRRRHQPGQRRADPDLRSPTTSWPATAPARSWPCPPTTSATSSSRTRFGLRDPAGRRRAGVEAADAPMDGAYVAHAADERARQQRAASTGCPPTRAARRSSPSWRRPAGPSPRSPTACATGWSAASATGARPSRSSTARRTASCPVPDDQLPVRLPETVDYAGSGDNPLNHDEAFLHVDVPALRRPRPARDRHDGHVHRLVVVLVPLPVAGRSRTGRSIAR